MALQKDITLSSGVVVKYHRVLRMNCDYVTMPGKTVVTVEVGCYLDKDARDEGKAPVITEVRRAVIEGGEVTREVLYGWLAQPVGYTTQKHPGPIVDGVPQLVDVEVVDQNTLTGFNGADRV